MCYSLGVDAGGGALSGSSVCWSPTEGWKSGERGKGADENVDGADGGCKRLPRWSTSLAVCLF